MTQPDSSKATASSTLDASTHQMGRRDPLIWTPEQLALLGTMSDAKVAVKIGVSQSAVSAKRNKLGIAPTSINRINPHSHHWLPEQIKLLGTMSDRAVAHAIGISEKKVFNKRIQLGIAPAGRMGTPTTRHDWTPEQIALLGTKTDLEVAQIIGTHKNIVLNQRMRLGIAPLKPIAKRLNWTPAMIAALGTLSDVDLAAQIGTRSDIVNKKRLSLGIAPFENRLNQADRIVPHIRTICQERGGVLLDAPSTYKNHHSKLLVRCAKGHLFRMTTGAIKRGAWCKECALEQSRVYNIADLHRFAQARGGQCHSTRYTGNKIKYDWECAKGHRWLYDWNNMQKLVNWCPKCRAIEDKKRKAEKRRQQATRYKKAQTFQTGLPKTK